ncbi:sigma-54-dependent Fis family transcriptional regulator [Polynucleobacter sp. MWH-Spelu-300-X4]|uniref:sigma-54-dependent Fis family transcriptional regulator n=1 Tax=Polynucleobacter sp. MWH-Spelu-300-X4 TaxID=2689109 RepID=UPI001BFE223D|nr:sigma-54-dependent Fis family transcriptional regulator [Polynucleobacter sp. MWH-Spelu-300-X4]
MKKVPDSELVQLRHQLKFSFETGEIWLGENRMVLMHVAALGALRNEIIESLGMERARGLLVRMGYASGVRDAELAKTLPSNDSPEDGIMLGPMLHSFKGMVRVEKKKLSMDLSKGKFTGEFLWENSWEAQTHLEKFGIGDDVECWSQVGYASGYVSTFVGRPVIFKETKCVCKGDHNCYIEGRLLENWEDSDDYLRYYKPDNIASKLIDLQEEVASLRASLSKVSLPDNIIGESEAFKTALNLASTAASNPITVLLLGETGVGKEVFAHWIHDNSDRASQPFIALNCAAIPNDLLESELFGVEKGAFTGAQQSRPGRFERANGGTLFLDEVGDLTLAAQVKLLRVLESGELERLGDIKTRQVNVRLITATNVNLQQAVKDGKFRADLYYRLNAYPVNIPPLRDRRADIPLLLDAFIKKYALLHNKRIPGVTDKAMRMLMSYDWPGNIRELENMMERGVLLTASDDRIELKHLFAGVSDVFTSEVELNPYGRVVDSHSKSSEALAEEILKQGISLEDHELMLMEAAVRKTGGNLAKAAELLGVTRRQIAYRLEKEDKK